MGFGKRAVPPTKTYTETNGGDGREIFFPTASGPNGARVSRNFRILPDLHDREETEIVFREWRSNSIMVRGQKSFRSCIVRDDNPIDSEVWREVNEIKARNDIDDAAKKELCKEVFRRQTSRQFVINVYHVPDEEDGTGSIKVLKGSWEAHDLDDETGLLKPRNAVGGNTLYGKMIAAMQEGASIPTGRKRLVEKDPTKFDLTFVTYGQGQFGKKNEIRPGMVYELDDEVPNLPRYNLTEWVEKATFPNEAILELLDGADYYEVVEKYGIQLYPRLDESTAPVETAVSSAEDDDPLFAE